MACSCCTEHPLIHGDCEVPTTPCLILYRKEKKAGVELEEIARFEDESLPVTYRCGQAAPPEMYGATIDLTDRHGRGHDMMAAGWKSVSPTRIKLVTPRFFYYLEDARLRAFLHHQEYMECLANNPQLPYPWQD